VGAPGPKTDPTVTRLARVRKACQALAGRPYRVALNELAAALQQIFSARLVVIRDSGELLGLAPAGIDPRDWLDALDALAPHNGDASPRSVAVPRSEAWPRASGIERFVVVPLDQPRGPGSIWLGFTDRATPSEKDLSALAVVGDIVGFALWRLVFESSLDTTEESSPGLDLTTGEIVSIAAHELRTPLTPITMLIQSLERKARSGHVDLEAIARMRRQVTRLTQMVADLLDLTRLREGRLVLTPVLVDIGPCLEQTIAQFRESEPKRTVEVTTPAEPLAILTDEQRFAEAMSNLLEHVARQSPSDSVIHVTVERRADRAAVHLWADRPQPPPDLALVPSPSTPPKTQPFALGVLVAEAVVMRFGGTIAITAAHHTPVSVEATFPLSASDKG
jgi:K+-sensing histidine kinase KdpD